MDEKKDYQDASPIVLFLLLLFFWLIICEESKRTRRAPLARRCRRILHSPQFDVQEPDDCDVALRHGIKPLNKIFRMGRPAILDLHGMTVGETRIWVPRFVCYCIKNSIDDALLITGKGLHSRGGISKLRPVVEEMLKNRGYAYTSRKGEFHVHFYRTAPHDLFDMW